jgi:gliding motility-associated-like protein
MKILFTLPLLVLSINSLSQIPTNELVGYWPFNGNANDESGNGNNGIVHGATLTTDRCGNENSAYYFNGNRQYIISENTINITGAMPRTISVWVKWLVNDYSPEPGEHDILGWGDWCNVGNNSWLNMGNYQGQNLPFGYARYNGHWVGLDSQFTIDKNTWAHIVLWYDGTTMKFFINGKEDPVTSNSVLNTIPTVLNIGYKTTWICGIVDDNGGWNTAFKGCIDDIRIYNRALSTEEILNLYNDLNCNTLLGLINGEGEVCQGQKNIRFFVQSLESATSYTWNYSGTGATINGSADSILIDFANNATSGDLSVTVTGNNISTQSRSIPIIVNSIPLAPETISGDKEVCKGQNGVVYAIPTINNATSYLWNYSGTGAVINGNSNNISIDFTGSATSGNLTVTGSNICGNGPQSDTFPIHVTSLPVDPGNIIGKNEVCLGQNGVPYEVTTIQNATNYLWSYSGTGSTIFGNSNSIQIYFANDATSGNLKVAGNNDCGIGPVSEDFSIEVASCENTPTPGIINIPNSFSPNGDGVNDLFIIRGLTENSSVMIYDRSGKKLYESVNYHNDWDGKGNDGNSLESDTYWYVIHISGIPSEFKGFVYLKR